MFNQTVLIKSINKNDFLRAFQEAVLKGARLKDNSFFFTSLPFRVEMNVELDSATDAWVETLNIEAKIPVEVKKAEFKSHMVESENIGEDHQKISPECSGDETNGYVYGSIELLSKEELEALNWNDLKKEAKRVGLKSTTKEAMIDEYLNLLK